jgi:hypothetical protein
MPASLGFGGLFFLSVCERESKVEPLSLPLKANPPSQILILLVCCSTTTPLTQVHRLPGALETLKELHDQFDFFVVSSRQAVIAEHTQKWLAEEYPDVFKGVLLGNHWGVDGVAKRLVLLFFFFSF